MGRESGKYYYATGKLTWVDYHTMSFYGKAWVPTGASQWKSINQSMVK